jgi:hypothetical protein
MRATISNQSAMGFRRKMRFAAALLFVFVSCSRASNEEPETRNAASAFYDIYMEIRPSGVPTQEQQAQLKPVISTRLAGLLHEAAAAEENSSKGTRSEASPTIEGDLFTSLDRGAVSYKILQCEGRKTPAACIVELENIDDRDNSKLIWKDRVLIVREGNRWVVDDVEFLGDRQFMHKGHLKGILSKVIEAAKKEAG